MAMVTAGKAIRGGKVAAKAVAVAALAGLLGACASKDKGIDLQSYVDTIEPADVLYNQALANMNSGKLNEASRKFEAVDRQHPYSEYARKANVMAAFTSYKMGKYSEAITAARRFVNLYPTDEDAAYAQYIIGLSYYAQIPEVTRDQRNAVLAMQNFNELIERYPDSIYIEDAKTKLRAARDQLAGKEMQVGRYYLERREYPAALNRFRTVVEDYANTRQVEERFGAAGRDLFRDGSRFRGADGRRGARPQLPGQPVVCRFLRAAAIGRREAARKPGFVDLARHEGRVIGA
jgi:outer membrane protein assembly factor BamD